MVKNVQLLEGYSKKLTQTIEHPSSKVQNAHELIQHMLHHSLTQGALNLRNFVKSCYAYHNEVSEANFQSKTPLDNKASE
jgi:hypothetical protein